MIAVDISNCSFQNVIAQILDILYRICRRVWLDRIVDALNFGLDQIRLTCKIHLAAMSTSLLVLLVFFS